MAKDDEIAFDERDGLLLVRTAYDERFIRSAKRLGGRWDPAERCWAFDPTLRRRVDSAVRRVFGREALSGAVEEPTEEQAEKTPTGEEIVSEVERFLRSQI